MAKATKKVTKKKKAAKRAAPKDVSEDDAQRGAIIDEISPEEAVELMDPKAIITPRSSKSVESVADKKDMRQINIPIRLKINRKRYEPGVHIVHKDLVPVILEMTDKKRKADISIFTGKKYLIQRLLDRTLVVKEVSELP